MKSPVLKRSIVLAGHKTSVSLEDAFWAGLKEIAGKRLMTVSSALRLFVLEFYRSQIPPTEGPEGLPVMDGPNLLSS